MYFLYNPFRSFASMSKIWFYLLALPLFAACSGNEGSGSQSTNGENGVGLDSLVTADRNLPADSLNEYLIQNPFDVNALVYRADRYIKANNIPYAEADVKAAMELDSLNPKVLLAWGDVNFYKNQTRQSRDAWQRCIEIDPESVDCRLKLAELYSIVQNYRESLKLVNKVMELDPNNPVAFFIKGNNVRDLTGDTAQSIRYVQQAIELDPEYWSALDYAAVMLANLHDPNAEIYYKRMIEIDPNNQPTYYKMGMFYMDQEMWNEAIAAFTKATQLRPTDAESFYNMGYIHLELGVNDVALDYFSKSIQARQVNHRAYYGRGFIYERMGDLVRAQSDYKQALAYNPQHEPSKIAIRRIQQIMQQNP